MSITPTLSYWLTLQTRLQELNLSDGWAAFREATATRRAEAIATLIAEGQDRHNFNVGFLAGLDWIEQYPAFAVDQIEKYKADLPVNPSI